MRTAIVLILAALSSTAALAGVEGGPCRISGPGAARVTCTTSSIATRNADGSYGRMQTWRFEIKR